MENCFSRDGGVVKFLSSHVDSVLGILKLNISNDMLNGTWESCSGSHLNELGHFLTVKNNY